MYFIHLRSTLLGVDKEIRRAFDPYAFVRDAYLQNRRYLLYDGNLPDEDLFEDDAEFDDEDFEDF
jgi:phospholipid-binding lipoprotein MlaA